MKIWADVYNAAGNKLGTGPIVNIRSASIARILDSAGDFSIEISGADGRALDILKPERRVIVYIEDGTTRREFFRGIVRNLGWNEAEGGKTFVVSGPDILNELARRNLFYQANYNNLSVETILTSMFSYAPGWEIINTNTDVTTLGFNGASVLTGLREAAKNTGLHFRWESGRRVKFGPMGDDSGLRIYQSSGGPIYENPDIALINRLEYRVNSEKLVNHISPAGAKSGTSYLGMGLIYGTSKSPYKVQQYINEFGPEYYLADANSIYEYGEIQAVVSFPNIIPASVSIGDQTNAANALYTAASNYLTRNKQPQNFYNCTVKNIRKTVLPGQKVYLQYKGDAWQGENRTWPVDIRDNLWVVRVSERFDQGGLSVDFELSEIDQVEATDDEMIANVMEETNRLE